VSMPLSQGIHPRGDVRRGRWGRRGALTFALLLTGCPGEDRPVTPEPDAGPDAPTTPAPEWRTVLEGLDGSLLAIWGASSKDVWSVGGSLGNGFESLVIRFDGTKWRREKPSPSRTETYWWVHGTSGSDVWLVGEQGRITHWDGASFREDTSGTTATLFGVMAFSATDVWAVGGTPESTTGPNDVVLHFDGASWKDEALPEKNGRAMFKVWGSSGDDLYVVGEAGTVWHRANGAFVREAQGVALNRLTTVHGCGPDQVIAVGGRELLTSNGKGEWKRSDMLLVNDVNGVSCTNAGGKPSAVIVGGGSLKLRLVDGNWVSDFGSPPLVDLHGAWVDEAGAMWAAGGQFAASAKAGVMRNGTVARYGEGIVSGAIDQ
jgi:hypothetical protein